MKMLMVINVSVNDARIDLSARY